MKVLIIFTLLISNVSFAKPFWTEKSIYEEGDQIFVVGIGSDAVTEEEGRLKALESAKTELRSYLSLSSTSKIKFQSKMTWAEKNGGKYKVYRLVFVDKKDIPELEKKDEGAIDSSTYQSTVFHERQTCSFRPVRMRVRSVKDYVTHMVSCDPIGNGSAYQKLIEQMSVQNLKSDYFLIDHVCTGSPSYDLNGRPIRTITNCW